MGWSRHMSITVSKTCFKARAFEYFRRVEKTGEPVIVTDRGRPVVEIRRHSGARKGGEDPLAELRGSVLRFDDPMLPVVDESEWEALR